MSEKMKKERYPIIGAIIMMITDLLSLLILFFKESFIVSIGIGGYRLLRTGSLGISVLVSFLYFGLMIRYFLQKKPKIKDIPIEKEENTLDINGKLSDDYILECITKQGRYKWTVVENDVKNITDQLILMNSYQDRLDKLLQNNNAKELSDAVDLLERIEQQILANVRKILNFMEILSPTSSEDVQTIREYIYECMAENTKLLNSTKDFLICVTGFLNDQGTNGKSLQMMEEFKAVLLGNIDDVTGNENIVLESK